MPYRDDFIQPVRLKVMLPSRQPFGGMIPSEFQRRGAFLSAKSSYASIERATISSYSNFEKSQRSGELFELRNYDSTTIAISNVVELVKFGVDLEYLVEKVSIVGSADVIMRVRDQSGYTPIDLKLTNDRSGYLILGFSDNKPSVPHSSLDLFGITLIGLLLARLMGQGKRFKVQSIKQNEESVQDDTDDDCDARTMGDYFRFSHNLICNLPGIAKNLITSDGRLYMRVFCGFWVDKVEINVLDCCKKHDIDLWCSESNLGAAGADEKVIACVTGAIIEQGLAKMDPWCGVLAGGYAQLLLQVSILYPTLAALGWTAQFGHDTVLIGFGGRNRDSCLCGGDKPTVFCKGDECRDVCSEVGKKRNCTKCGYGCVYNDVTGKAIGYKHLKDPGGKICCPGTQAGCGGPKQKDLKVNCPDKLVCTPCEYRCDICHTYKPSKPNLCLQPGVGRLSISHLYGERLPCCPGTPKPVPRDFCPKIPGLGEPDTQRLDSHVRKIKLLN